jgi:hypothetical protein
MNSARLIGWLPPVSSRQRISRSVWRILPAVAREAEEVEAAMLAGHQLDEVLFIGVGEQVRHRRGSQAHEVARPDLVGRAVDLARPRPERM